MLAAWFGKHEVSLADRWIFGVMLACGLLGLAASFTLVLERFIQLTDPNAQLICNVNAIFNCGTVMQTWQAKLFGFPNALIGLTAYPVVITMAVAGLLGTKLPRAFLVTAQLGFGLGLVFAYWLFFQSVFVIHVLCPLCLIITLVTTILFETLLRYNFRENSFKLAHKTNKKVMGWLQKDYDKLLTAAWLTAMVMLVLIMFPDIF
jgi:uncharacterized membrane protein